MNGCSVRKRIQSLCTFNSSFLSKENDFLSLKQSAKEKMPEYSLISSEDQDDDDDDAPVVERVEDCLRGSNLMQSRD